MYNIGRTNNVSNVAVTSPPITTVANGRCTSDPGPVLTAIGMKPKLATKAVMSTGLKRLAAPLTVDNFRPIPLPRNALICETSTMPFRTATPNKATNPIPAVTEMYMPRIQRANSPPDNANGRLININKT